MSEIKLPPMPIPDGTVYGENRSIIGHAILTEKVRDYARAAVELNRKPQPDQPAAWSTPKPTDEWAGHCWFTIHETEAKEWAAKGWRVDALYKQQPAAGREIDPIVKCKCGWQNKQSSLTKSFKGNYYCPDCGEYFTQWPQAQAEPVAGHWKEVLFAVTVPIEATPDQWSIHYNYWDDATPSKHHSGLLNWRLVDNTHPAPREAVTKTDSFLKERAQLEQEWCELRKLKSQYERALGLKTILPEGLAEHIAKAIFDCGDEPWSQVKRIAFIGTCNDDLGGLALEPLTRVIKAALAAAPNHGGEK